MARIGLTVSAGGEERSQGDAVVSGCPNVHEKVVTIDENSGERQSLGHQAARTLRIPNHGPPNPG